MKQNLQLPVNLIPPVTIQTVKWRLQLQLCANQSNLNQFSYHGMSLSQLLLMCKELLSTPEHSTNISINYDHFLLVLISSRVCNSGVWKTWIQRIGRGSATMRKYTGILQGNLECGIFFSSLLQTKTVSLDVRHSQAHREDGGRGGDRGYFPKAPQIIF